MYDRVNFYTFSDRFNKLRPDNFSYEGLKALFDYLEQLEEDTETEIEFDCIAICCEFDEYSDLESFQDEYGKDEFKTIDDIQEATTVIMIDDESFIIRTF